MKYHGPICDPFTPVTPSMAYSLGLDYGTNSCRALIVRLTDGQEMASAVFPYPTGELGIVLDPADPNLARQNPQDYIDGLEQVVRQAIEQARAEHPGFDPMEIIGIGVDTTGSTPIPVNREGVPLAMLPEFANNPAAMVWLWRDHTGHAEAAEITDLAARERPQYLAKCGGIYSSEWWWSKILRCRRVAPDVFAAAWSWVEHCDWIPAVLTGTDRPEHIVRGICSAGHKAMFHEEWGGLPDAEFLAKLHPDLAELRGRLYDRAVSADHRAGDLTEEWAGRLGLKPGIAVAVGAFDAHMGAVGAGVREGVLVKIMGTSTCDITVAPLERELPDVPGLCGIVPESVMAGTYGIEAGQSAVGDIFLWFVRQLVPESYGADPDSRFAAMEQALESVRPGASGLLALDWHNGNRTVLVDPRLTGLLLGQTLHTKAHEIYRAFIEATAFGALTIIRRMEDYGIRIDEVVNTGGLAVKNATLMQIYADILNRPMKVAASDQTCALGAALFGAVASGEYQLADLQQKCCHMRGRVYEPNPEHRAIYDELYALYLQLHDAFGTDHGETSLGPVMKKLLDLRDLSRA